MSIDAIVFSKAPLWMMLVTAFAMTYVFGHLKRRAYRAGFDAGCADKDGHEIRLFNRLLATSYNNFKRDVSIHCRMAESHTSDPEQLTKILANLSKLAAIQLSVEKMKEQK